MGVNLDRPGRWKADIAQSVDLYNQWFLSFAPQTYREERVQATNYVQAMLQRTGLLKNLHFNHLKDDPLILASLRMSTAPPVARDRLIGLAHVPKSLVNSMEKEGRLPSRMSEVDLAANLEKIVRMISWLIDVDIFPWIDGNREPGEQEVYRAATIVADRLCGANADPIIRNAQEARQLAKIKAWLESYGYRDVSGGARSENMEPGTFAFHLNVQGLKENNATVNIPVDVAVLPVNAKKRDIPFLIEAKSAGDFTNTNKRRKEEAIKVSQLRRRLGDQVQYVLFLCGYFDSGYLGYEAAENIDWVWEHRVDDLKEFGL